MNKLADVSSTLTSRFSLILLEPGEIYFEDYLVYYHELKCPFDKNKETVSWTKTEPVKGNLKICSKSVVFDPINFSHPLVKFSYKSIDKIVLFNDNDEDVNVNNNDNDDDIYATSTTSSTSLRQKCFAISAKQSVHCKLNNKIAPYVLNKGGGGGGGDGKSQQQYNLHYFELIFTNVNDSLDLLMQLHRASTLEYEQEDLMLQLILKSRLNRDFKFDVHHLEDVSKEQIQFEAMVNKINPLVANPGKIILTNMCIYYKPFNNLLEDHQTSNVFKIRLKNIKYVIKRRYHLKKVGCEIIFDNSASASASNQTVAKNLPYLYLTFDDEYTRDLFHTKLIVEQSSKLTNLEEFNQDNMLQKWRYGAISNFDYLMYLNNIADRSYNDLTQYPVFPWVLSNYSSVELDLTEPNSFRDLSKPIGALNDDRLARLRQRYFEMQATTTKFGSNDNDSTTTSDTKQPMFLYGSHYSTPAFVLFYLVREHPEWQLCLQNGRFDQANRLFHSIEDTWRNCMTIDSDVKELIPEFYDLGSTTHRSELGAFLRNDLELDLGVRSSDGVRVNNVILPQWARGSTATFVERMRDALESAFVSENLHKWIDLIFGYKQTGQEAINANNLFYYLCYEGAVDLDSIKDYSQRKSLEIQIQEFGQIPTQLFKTAHLPKSKQIELIDVDWLTSSSSSNPEQQEEIADKPLKSFESETAEIIKKAPNPFKITAATFSDLEVKLSVKLHKSQVNDLLFLDEHLSTNKTIDPKKPELPLLCSVSNDNWIKIYSLHEHSVFRSHNVANFNLSSVDCVQILKTSALEDDLNGDDDFAGSSFESNGSNGSNDNRARKASFPTTTTNNKFTQTLLFLSCWDNSIYIYDMNYNRCIHQLADSHDDAISRLALIKIPHSNSFLLLSSSWDSSVKIWLTSPITNRALKRTEQFKLQFLNELSHDSAVLDFCLTRSYLASICDDGNVVLWKLNQVNNSSSGSSKTRNHIDDTTTFAKNNSSCSSDEEHDEFKLDGKFLRLHEQPSLETTYLHQYSIEHSSELGKITDCKIIEANSSEFVSTIAVCSSLGFVKIFNINTNVELFSIRINVNDVMPQINAKLNKLVYSNDYILTVDASGYLYFIDLQQQFLVSTANSSAEKSNSSSLKPTKSSFLSHFMKLSNNCLHYKHL